MRRGSLGDRAALSELVSDPAVEGRVRRTAANVLARYGSRGVFLDAVDLEQEVYAELLTGRIKTEKDIRSEREFYAWISRLVRNIYTDSLRRNMSMERALVEEDEVFQTERSGNQYYETALRELLGKLETDERTIFEMRTEGYTLREIADKLGISQASATRRLTRAFKTILGEVDELTTRMKESQIEIEQEKELTRHLINELRA